MKKVDMYWMANREWLVFTKNGCFLKADAPEEAQESFKRYMAQTNNANILRPHLGVIINGDEETPHTKSPNERQIILR